jgi:hypothetical protein
MMMMMKYIHALFTNRYIFFAKKEDEQTFAQKLKGERERKK